VIESIRWLEELGMNAWPALHTMLYDGWVIRFANGYTKRANSVNPLYRSDQPLEEKIRSCEHLYHSRDLEVVFKMTPDACPRELDEMLAARGYRVVAPTSVQVRALPVIEGHHVQESRLDEMPLEEWLTSFCELGGVGEHYSPTLQAMLACIAPQRAFACLHHAGQVVACGLGVVQSGFVGLFDVITHEGFRRQGYGRQMVLDLLAWGRRQGAEQAYLQVVLSNTPAVGLYAGLGFKEHHRYWYRVGP